MIDEIDDAVREWPGYGIAISIRFDRKETYIKYDGRRAPTNSKKIQKKISNTC